MNNIKKGKIGIKRKIIKVLKFKIKIPKSNKKENK